MAFDVDNDMGAAETGVDKEVDIMGLGMRVTDAGFDLGAGILNVTETILCNGFKIGNKDDFMAPKVQGSGNKTTKFYWYLDTDGNESNGCEDMPHANRLHDQSVRKHTVPHQNRMVGRGLPGNVTRVCIKMGNRTNQTADKGHFQSSVIN